MFPSTTETFGNVVLEAMASGTVPVCSDEGGASSSIKDNQNGIICKAKNSFDYSKKIIKLLNNSSELSRMSDNCVDYASTQTWENIFSNQYQGYLDVINNHAPKNIDWDHKKTTGYLQHTINSDLDG